MAKKRLRSPPVASTSLPAGRGGRSSSANLTEEGSSSSSTSAEEAFHDEYHPFSATPISSFLLTSEKEARHVGQGGGKASKGARRTPSKGPSAEKTKKEKDSNRGIRSTGGKTAAPPPLSSSSSLLPSPESSLERSSVAARSAAHRRRAASKAVVQRTPSTAVVSRSTKEVKGGGEVATALSSPSSITEVSTRTRTHARKDSLVLEGVGAGKSTSKERSQKRKMKVTAVKEQKGVKNDSDTTATFVHQKTTQFATHTKEQAADVKTGGTAVGRRVKSSSRAVSTVTTSSSSLVTAPLATSDWPSLSSTSLLSLDESSEMKERPKGGDTTTTTTTPSSSSVRKPLAMAAAAPRSRRVKEGTLKKRGRTTRLSRSPAQTRAKKTSGGPKRTPTVKKKGEEKPQKSAKKGGEGKEKEEEEASLPSSLPSSNPSHDTTTFPQETPATLPRRHASSRPRSRKATHKKKPKQEKMSMTKKKKRFLVGKKRWKTRAKPVKLHTREKRAKKTPPRRGSTEDAKRLSKKAPPPPPHPPHPPLRTPSPSSSPPLSSSTASFSTSHLVDPLPSLTSTIATVSAVLRGNSAGTAAAAAVHADAVATEAPLVKKDRRKRSPLAVALLPDAPSEAPLLYPPSDQPSLPSSTRSRGVGGEKIFEEEVGEEEGTAAKPGSRRAGVVVPSPFFPSSAFCGAQMESVFLFIICACKAAYAVPSIYFNATSGRVEPNPYYGRHTAAKRIALQGVVPNLLFPVSSLAAFDHLTPREALLCLEKALLLLFTSLFASFPALEGGGGGKGASGEATLSSSSSSSSWSSVFSSAAAAIHSETNDADLHAAVLLVLEAQERLHTPVVCHKDVRSALPFISSLQHCLAHRTASPFQIATLGHLLHGSVGGGGLTSLTLMEYLTALRQRIRIERAPMELHCMHRRSPAESFSLDVSTKSVEDLVAALEAVQVGYIAVQVPTTPSTSSSSLSVSSCVASASLLCQGFYRLLRVVLQLSSLDGFLWRYATGAALLPLPTNDGKQTGRHGSDGGGGGDVGGFQLPPQLASRVTQFDPSTGRLTLARASCTIPWGLELNRAGELVSLHHHTRHATAEGGDCFQALQHDSSFPGVGATRFVPRGWYVVKVEEEKIPLVRPPPPPPSLSSSHAREETDGETTGEEKERAAWVRQEQVEQWEYRTTHRYRKLLMALQKASTPVEERISEGYCDDGRDGKEGKKKKTPKKTNAFQGKTLHLELALFPSLFSLGSTAMPPRVVEGGGDRLGVSEVGFIPLSHALGSSSSSSNGSPRVLLLLERPSTAVPWGLSLEFPPVPPSFTPPPFDAAVPIPSETQTLSSAERARKRRLAQLEVEEKSFCGPAFSPRLLRIASPSTVSERHHQKKKKKTTKSSKRGKPSFSLQLSPTTQEFVDRFAGELWVRGINGMPTIDVRSGLPHVLYSSTPLPVRSTSSSRHHHPNPLLRSSNGTHRMPYPLTSGLMSGAEGGGGSGSGGELSASPTSSIFGSRRHAVHLSGKGGPWRNRAALSQFLSSSLVLALELERVRPTPPESNDDHNGHPNSSSSPPPTSGGGGVFRTNVTPPGWALAETPNPLLSVAASADAAVTAAALLEIPTPTTPAAAAVDEVEDPLRANDPAAVVVATEGPLGEMAREEEGTTPDAKAAAPPPRRRPRLTHRSSRLHHKEKKKETKTKTTTYDSGMKEEDSTPEETQTSMASMPSTAPTVTSAVDLSASLSSTAAVEEEEKKRQHVVVDRTAMGDDAGREVTETPMTVVVVPSAKEKVLRVAVAAAAAVAKMTRLPSSPEEEENPHTKPMEEKRRAVLDRTLTSPSAPKKVRLVDLMDAPALDFGNRVVMESYDGTVAAFQRPSLQVPWEMNMAIKGADIWLTRLPPFPSSLVQPSSGKGEAASVKHPFGVYLGASPDGTVRAKVEEINGKDVALMSKLQRQNALQSIRGEKTLRLVLQSMRK